MTWCYKRHIQFCYWSLGSSNPPLPQRAPRYKKCHRPRTTLIRLWVRLVVGIDWRSKTCWYKLEELRLLVAVYLKMRLLVGVYWKRYSSLSVQMGWGEILPSKRLAVPCLTVRVGGWRFGWMYTADLSRTIHRVADNIQDKTDIVEAFLSFLSQVSDPRPIKTAAAFACIWLVPCTNPQRLVNPPRFTKNINMP